MNSILCIALLFKKRNPCLKIIITGIFPWDNKFSGFRIIVPQVNQFLKIFTPTYDFIDFLEPTKDWLKYNGDLNHKLFWTDHLHLSKLGNKKFASSIFTLLHYNLNITTKFQLKPTTEDIALKLLKDIDISKAAGVDNLPGRFLKDGAVILAKPVTEICNLSIKSKIFPDPCKLAKLKPIFKKGSRMDPSNYRPISLLPLISKIFEKIVHDQMIDYLAQYKILYK